MKYGIQLNDYSLMLDDNLSRLQKTLEFMPDLLPSLIDPQIKEFEEGDIELGIDGKYYILGKAPQKDIETLRKEKLEELEKLFVMASEEAHCASSVGFEIDANSTANRNIEGLILVLEDGENTQFRAYDNSFHVVTKEQLIEMRKEIVVNSQELYGIKWDYESKIVSAETKEELDAIVIDFDKTLRSIYEKVD